MITRLLIISDESGDSLRNIFGNSQDYRTSLIKIKSAEKIKNHSKQIKSADLVIIDVEGQDPVGYAKQIRNNLSLAELPVIFVTSGKSGELIDAVFSIGHADLVSRPVNKYELLARIKEQLNLIELNEKSKVKNSMLELIGEKLVEKNTILETSLDILVHDTKNMFLNIQYNISQVGEPQTRDTLKEQFDNLHSLIMQTAGYMNSKKRICSLYEIVKSIHLTKDRIPIETYKRVNFLYNMPGILFIESTMMIKNAVVNLIENALKYSPGDTVVNVKLERVGKRIYINVEDRGPGVPDSEKQKIFRKHYRRKETKAIEGSGWGLWITHSIVKKEGGMVYVTDNPEGGSVFTIELPAYTVNNLEYELKKLSEWFDTPFSVIKDKENTMRTMLVLQNNHRIDDIDTCVFTSLLIYFRNKKKRKDEIEVYRKLEDFKKLNPDGKSVLIVDDSIYVHFYMAAYLTELGYRVLDYAKNGREGVNYYKEYKPDIVTLDYTMPVLSGLDAAKEIYEFDHDASIVFITAAGQAPNFLSKINTYIPEDKIKVLVKPVKKEDIENIFSDFKEKIIID